MAAIWSRRQCVNLGPDSILRCRLTGIGNPIVEIRRSYDRLISTMGFPIPVRRHLYIESGPWWLMMASFLVVYIVEETGASPPCERFSTTCAFSVLRNDRKYICIYIYICVCVCVWPAINSVGQMFRADNDIYILKKNGTSLIIEMSSYQYKNSHYKYKTVSRSKYFSQWHHGFQMKAIGWRACELWHIFFDLIFFINSYIFTMGIPIPWKTVFILRRGLGPYISFVAVALVTIPNTPQWQVL